MFGGFCGEVSVQTASAHIVFTKVVELPLDPCAQPTKWRQLVVPQRRADVGARHLVVALDDLESEGFLRSKVIREGALRHTRRLDDVTHARGPEPALMNQSQTFREQRFLVRRAPHVSDHNTYVRTDCQARPPAAATGNEIGRASCRERV